MIRDINLNREYINNNLAEKRYFDKDKFEFLIYEKRKDQIISLKKRKMKKMLDKIIVFASIFSICLTLLFSFISLTKKLQIMAQNRKISKLQTVLLNKKNNNEVLDDKIKNMFDKNKIKTDAELELGMHEPTKNDYIYFDKSKVSYVRHYDDIKK